MAFVVKKPGDEVKQERRGYSAVLYGPPMVGKTTTLHDDSDWRVCLIDLDKNSTTVEESENVTIIGVDTFDEYLSVKQGVNTGTWKYPGGELKMDFDMYAIDSFTTLEEKIKRYVVEKYAPNRRREIQSKFGAQSDWGDLQDIEIGEVRDWQAMTKRAVNPVNVLWIGHDNIVKNDMGQASATELLLQGNYAAPRIASAVDAMFYMFKMEKDGKIGRGIYTIDKGIYKADARIAIERKGDIPSVIWFPKWSKIFPMLGYKK
jgi:hypothetical protein